MDNVKSRIENGVRIISLSGKIDSMNAPQIEAAINAEPMDGATSTVIDAEDLLYVSSAGLRVFLRMRKRDPDMKIINVSNDVYDIFDITGFTEMLDIEKAYRRVSVEGCEVIGQGANGMVYRIDPETIIKVYRDPDSLPDIKRERELARRAFVLGIPTAIPYDVVKVGDGYGSVFELLNAKSFAKLITEGLDTVDHVVKMYIDLLKKIHSTEVKPDDMPSMKDVALRWADASAKHLPEAYGAKLRSLVDSVPDDLHMMHGDYHVKNVMLQDGEALLIDMDTICHGHPVFELASMFNAYRGFSEVDHEVVKRFLGIDYETTCEIWDKSLRLYLGTDDEAKIAEVEKKAMLAGFMRLYRRAIRKNDSEATINGFRDRLMSLIDEVDSLVF
ncbi:MAG: anti-sigma factor antagonist [Clostridia bacterium]|nr:anti-sigma factor antagonist [Clostridia bacterium]